MDEKSPSLTPYFGADRVAADREGVLYKATDTCGRPVALHVFRRNSGMPSDPSALRAYARLVHPHLQRLHCVGSLRDGSLYLACGWIDGAPVAALNRPLADEAVRRAAFELTSALAFLHSQRLVHGTIDATSVWDSEEGFIITRPQALTHAEGAGAATSSDLAGLGRALLTMSLGAAGVPPDPGPAPAAQALAAVRDSGLRGLIGRLLGTQGSCFRGAEEAFASCLAMRGRIDAAAARSVVGYRRFVDPMLEGAFDAALKDVWRGRSSALFVEGRWGTSRRELIDALLDQAAPTVLPLRARHPAGTWDTARIRLEDGLRTACAGLGEPAARLRPGPAAAHSVSLAQRLIEISGRKAIALAVEIDEDPSSDDPFFLEELVAHMHDLPVLLLAHAGCAPRALPHGIAMCRLGFHPPRELVDRFFLPGPSAHSIKRNLAVESGGRVEMFRQGLLDTVVAKGVQALDGTWKGRRGARLTSTTKDRVRSLPVGHREVLGLVAYADAPLPRATLSEREWEIADELSETLGLGEAISGVPGPDLRRAARLAGISPRDASVALLRRIEEKGLKLTPLTLAGVLERAGRPLAAIERLKEAGLDEINRIPSQHAGRLFARLAPHASRLRDTAFWVLRGDWAVGREQYREGIGHYQRAMTLAAQFDPRLVCTCALAAESAADYRTALRVAEDALEREVADDHALPLRCAAARSRFLLGDNAAAESHWDAARALCKQSRREGLDEGICLRDYGYFLLKRGRRAEALRSLATSERILSRLGGHRAELAQAVHYIGLLHRNEGDLVEARRRLEAAAHLYAEDGNLLKQGKAASDLALVFMEEEQWESARRHLDASLGLFRKIRNARAVTLASYNVAEIMLATGEYQQSRRVLEQCLQMDRASGNLRSMAYDLSSLGLLAIYEGEWGSAEARLTEALEVFEGQGDAEESVDTLLKLAKLSLAQGSIPAAQTLLARAKEGLTSLGPCQRLETEMRLLTASSQLKLGRFDAAMDEARRVIEHPPRRASVGAAAELILAESAARKGRGRDVVQRYRRALAEAVRSANPYLQAEARLSMLEHRPEAALEDVRFCEETEELLDRSGHRGMIQRYRAWHEETRTPYRLKPIRRFAPPGVEAEVYRIGRRVGEGNADEAVTALVLDAIIERLGAETGALVLNNPPGQPFISAARGATGMSGPHVLKVAESAMKGATHVVVGLKAGGLDDALRSRGIVSALAVPLFRKGAVTGAVYLDRRGPVEAFSNEEAEFVAALADGLSIGLRLPGGPSSRPARVERHHAFEKFITVSERTEAVLTTASRVAPRDVSVLICGESGTGKELLARAIHDMSGRNPDRFVSVNCSAIPEALLESEFFGYRRGAFTDARTDRAGLIEEADGGTLFLDEIGEMPLKLQAKLLRVVQEREFRRIGETRTRTSDLRIISATNRDLSSEVAAGRFREDLFYRLQVVALTLPPLRERREDIVPLAEHYVAQYAQGEGRTAPRLGGSARAWLLRQRWPGNVRELQNALHRALLSAGDARVLEREHFDQTGLEHSLACDVSGAGFAAACRRFERAYLIESLQRASGNRTACARELGLSRQGLFKLIRKHGINT